MRDVFTDYASTEGQHFHQDAAYQLQMYIIYDNEELSSVEEHTKADSFQSRLYINRLDSKRIIGQSLSCLAGVCELACVHKSNS